MSASKCNNIILIVLVLLNAFLLSILLFDKAEERRTRQDEIASLISVLEEKGISVAEDLDFDISAPAPCTISRDEKCDNRLMDRLINYNYREDLGGNIIFYRSEKGEAMLYGTGVISLLFHDELPELSGDYARSVAGFLDRKGIEMYPAHGEVNLSNDGATVVIPCAYDGRCIYNSRLSFTISGDRLMMIDGTRPFDGEYRHKDDQLIDSVSAIMYFLDYVRSDGYICSRISSLEAGYFLSVAVSGESSLSPVWRVGTDTGEVYINAVSGRVESLTA